METSMWDTTLQLANDKKWFADAAKEKARDEALQIANQFRDANMPSQEKCLKINVAARDISRSSFKEFSSNITSKYNSLLPQVCRSIINAEEFGFSRDLKDELKKLMLSQCNLVEERKSIPVDAIKV